MMLRQSGLLGVRSISNTGSDRSEGLFEGIPHRKIIAKFHDAVTVDAESQFDFAAEHPFRSLSPDDTFFKDGSFWETRAGQSTRGKHILFGIGRATNNRDDAFTDIYTAELQFVGIRVGFNGWLSGR